MFKSPFNNAHNSVLFVNGIIHFIMFVLFLTMYINDSQINYLYVFIAFLISSILLIICSIINWGLSDYNPM
jgi:hypothetical protein